MEKYCIRELISGIVRKNRVGRLIKRKTNITYNLVVID